jgi:parallel beta-helix repeat protein
VATDGDDGNPGTFSRPWKTIQKAANSAVPGIVVAARGGVYHERVTVNVSGSAAGGYITFRNYGKESAVVDGTGLAVPSTANGLFLIADRSYIIIKGFEIRNFRTSVKDRVPAGVHVRGASRHIQIRNNKIHHIEHNGTAANGVDAHGIAVYGTDPSRPVTGLIIAGNELFALKLGSSESLAVNGNVDGFRITNNLLHDNNNIGIDAIGFEGTSPDPATDQARNGVIAKNIVYNINSYLNPAYGTDRSAAGIYVDGGINITIERNIVHHCNIGIELASEHAGRATSFITVRNNFVYLNEVVGISMGGYDALRGSTENCAVVNNTLFRNDRLRWGNGELQLQYDTGNNVIANNIFYANSQNYLITNPFTNNTGNVIDYNIYFAPGGPAGSSWQWKKTWHKGFPAYRASTGNDGHSLFVNPAIASEDLPDLHLKAVSPAIDRGEDLGAAGLADIDGQLRIQGSIIDIGADEVR